MEKREVKSVADGMMEIMAIMGDAPTKSKAKRIAHQTGNGELAAKAVEKVSETVYEHGSAIVIDGKKVAKGYVAKKKGGAKGPKNDAGKDALRAVYEAPIKAIAPESFNHSSEGLVIRESEADYTFKISKAKENKYDPTAEDFEVDKDFTVRGKAKNSAPKYAKVILAALEKSEIKFTLISARASGIILHMDGAEYTIKISKKRDRVGFEAEKGAAYEK